MDKVATDLTRILGPERLLWEREHLATYGFDGTAALYAEAGCVALPKTVVVEEEAQQMAEIAWNHGARAVQVAHSAEEAIQFTTARRVAFSALARVSPTTILEDATVPRSELAKMIRFIQDTAAKYEVTVGTFGHMGDRNLHPTFLTNEKNEVEMGRVERAMEAIVDQAVKVGGTITGEHGVGLAKKAFLPGAIGDASLGIMRQLKRTLDPDNILNPGKIFD